MTFIHRARFFSPLNVKAYVHSSGFGAYDGSIQNALEHISRSFGDVARLVDKQLHRFEYAVAIAWGNGTGDKMVDYFLFHNIGAEWPGNPTVRPLTIRNGGIDMSASDRGCGDGIILCGAEEYLRRKCKNLDDFMGRFADIGELYSQHN